MIRTFLKPCSNKTIEAKKINTETGEVTQYFINNGLADTTTIKFPFSFYQTTAEKMGYTSPSEMIKELKRRKQLGEEVNPIRQEAEEINALLDLAKLRVEKGYNLYDIEDKLLNIYGLTEDFTFKTLDNITA